MEIALKAVAHRLMQQDARPARAEENVHFTRRRWAGFECHEALAQGFLGGGHPDVFSKIGERLAASAQAMVALALFLAVG